MSGRPEHITVCICTFQRPERLQRLLEELAAQDARGAFRFSIAVADNDAAGSARAVVEAFGARFGVAVSYAVEPRQNIALARNRALALAQGEYVAFIDDDELPARDWLWQLHRACVAGGVAGVLGPVLPLFEQEPPAWLRRGGFYDRPVHRTGEVLSWPQCRTGNVLFRRAILDPSEPAFRAEFGTGGEDQDFFRRMMERGHRFIWCAEAAVHEVVPPTRWSRRFLLRRAWLRGRNSWRQERGRWRNLGKSLVAVPLYGVALPFLLLAGQHRFMRYLVKWTDHAGRLLAAVGLNAARERPM